MATHREQVADLSTPFTRYGVVLIRTPGRVFKLESLAGEGEDLFGDLLRSSRDSGELFGHADSQTSDLDALTKNVARLTPNIVALSGGVGVLTNTVVELTFNVFPLQSGCKQLSYNGLAPNQLKHP